MRNTNHQCDCDKAGAPTNNECDCVQHRNRKVEFPDAKAAYVHSMDKYLAGELTLQDRDAYRNGFYDGIQYQKSKQDEKNTN